MVVVWGVIEELESVNQADFLKLKKIQITAFFQKCDFEGLWDRQRNLEMYGGDEDAIPCPPE